MCRAKDKEKYFAGAGRDLPLQNILTIDTYREGYMLGRQLLAKHFQLHFKKQVKGIEYVFLAPNVSSAPSFFALPTYPLKKCPMHTSSKLDASTLWQEHHDALLAFIRSRVADRAASLDILQEVFLKILHKLDTLHASEKVKPWLYQITRNAIADHYRRQRTATAEPQPELPEALPDDDTAMRHIESCIRPMIHSLPPIYREALLLSEIEGLSQKELAVRLGISYSGAKTRVQRGRLLLRQALTDCCTFEIDRYGKILEYRPNPQPPCGDC